MKKSAGGKRRACRENRCQNEVTPPLSKFRGAAASEPRTVTKLPEEGFAALPRSRQEGRIRKTDIAFLRLHRQDNATQSFFAKFSGRHEVYSLSISSEALELRGEPCSFTSSFAGVAELADALDSKSDVSPSKQVSSHGHNANACDTKRPFQTLILSTWRQQPQNQCEPLLLAAVSHVSHLR